MRRLVSGFLAGTAIALLLAHAPDQVARAGPTSLKNPPTDAPVRLAKAVDYSKYLTFIRKQTGGGCGTMTSLAIFDILKEKEYPYAPDGSYRFAAWVYNDRKINQLDILQQFGCCSEASLHTNDDLWDKQPVPSPENYEEAAIYRLGEYSEQIHQVTVNDLKRYLYMYGPIFASGDTPNSATHGHVFAVVGYDDDKSEFTIVNSFGDRWGNKGFMQMPYANITNPPPTQTSPRVDWYRWVKDKPASRIVPYTGRVRIHHTIARRYLTVKVGVQGHEPMVIWDRPNNVQGPDDCSALVLDFPLPKYAAKFWPPSSRSRWYVEVTDSSPGAPSDEVATVEGITLAWRRAGKSPVLFQPAGTGITIPRGGTVKVQIP